MNFDLSKAQNGQNNQTFVGQMNALEGKKSASHDEQNNELGLAGVDKTAFGIALASNEMPGNVGAVGDTAQKSSDTLPIPPGRALDDDTSAAQSDAPTLLPLEAEIIHNDAPGVDLSALDHAISETNQRTDTNLSATPTETVIAGKIPIYGAEENASDETSIHSEDKTDAKDAEHYEVNVRHYASYDKTNEDVYAEQTRENLQYAAKTPWARFLVDFMNVMVRPIHFWEGQAEHQATMAQVHFPHLVILVCLRAIAVFVGGFLRHGTDKIEELISAISQALLIFVFVWLLALVYSGIMAFAAKGFHFSKCLNFVAYAITPLLVINVLSVFPIPHISMICDLIALPYVFVVLGAGMLPFLKVPEKNAPILCGLFCGLMMCLWSVVPILMPRLISIH